MATTMQSLQVPFVDLRAQYAALEEEVNRVVLKVMRDADFILGRDVKLFEEEFAAYCEAGYGIAVDSGTSALELILRAFEIGPGDEVITVANTFIATVLAISATGATPVLVDIDPATYTIDVVAAEAAITPRTRAILPVHLYGQPADMDPVLALAERHGLIVVEDACQAHGARYKGCRIGGISHAAAFSFYPAKNLGAYGDAGIVTTNDERIANSVRMLRDYGQREKYHHLLRGYNRRMDTIQAAVLRAKLPHLDDWNAARQQHAADYQTLLAESNLVLPEQPSFAESVYHLFVVRSEARDTLKNYLTAQGIATGVHYPIPIHLQPAYADLGHKVGDFPVTEQFAGQLLSLPMYPEMTSEHIDQVVHSIMHFAKESRVGV
jgi:dTDP-4-amino-4,6-dideoxygalactose transaminase